MIQNVQYIFFPDGKFVEEQVVHLFQRSAV